MAELRQDVERLVSECLADALEEAGAPAPVTAESRIYGGGSPLDSTAVVSLVIDVEGRLAEELELTISLTDERAMSQKHSPFRDVRNMVDYVVRLCGEPPDG